MLHLILWHSMSEIILRKLQQDNLTTFIRGKSDLYALTMIIMVMQLISAISYIDILLAVNQRRNLVLTNQLQIAIMLQ